MINSRSIALIVIFTMTSFRSITWQDRRLILLDQRFLPHQTIYREYTDYISVAEAIAEMIVRGAPAIGVAAAFGLVLASDRSSQSDLSILRQQLEVAAARLIQSRPTAVNLAWAVKRMMELTKAEYQTAQHLHDALLIEAEKIYAEDIEINLAIAEHAQSLVPDRANVIHHCNTGSLATVDYGTALGIIRIAHEKGKQIHAYLDETRPRLQGASLSAYELQAFGVPHTLIVDSASGHLMRTRKIDFCVVGCDHVTANGDVANKIGTYNLAIAARAHQVPFYVACPISSIDFTITSGDQIEIEERNGEEITHIQGVAIAPIGTKVFNPAFDITPSEYISAIITEKGILYPPYSQSLAQLLLSHRKNRHL
jgi:methylthioribose-1-phosphate isomerase